MLRNCLCFYNREFMKVPHFLSLVTMSYFQEAFQAYEEDSHINSSAIVSTSIISLFFYNCVSQIYYQIPCIGTEIMRC